MCGCFLGVSGLALVGFALLGCSCRERGCQEPYCGEMWLLTLGRLRSGWVLPGGAGGFFHPRAALPQGEGCCRPQWMQK